MLFLVLTFVVCTAALVAAGTGLSRYADILAEKTGIGKAWIGMTAVAISTSLPELSTGISAVVYADSPNIALGDALGSCVFNLAIIALIDFMIKQEPMRVRLCSAHLLTAGTAVVILGLVLFGLVLQPYVRFHFLHFSLLVPLIFAAYVICSRLIFKFEKRELTQFIKKEAEKLCYEKVSMKRTVLMLAACGAVVAVSGTLLPKLGIGLAESFGVGRGFVGSVFIAFSTSLPEVVVAVAAVRIGAIDIAVGNIFGSNIFNCVVIAVDDLFYTSGPIFAEAAPGQAVTAVLAIVMTGVALVGLQYKSRKKVLARIGWDSLALIGLYATNVVTSYSLSGGR